MRCTIPLSTLLPLLRDCINLLAAKPSLPITGHLLLTTHDDHITLTATNLETTIVAQCPASIVEAGTVTLPGKQLYDIVKELSGETIHLQHKPHTLTTTLTCQKSRVQLIGLPPADFPAIPSQHTTPLFSLPHTALDLLLQETLSSAGPLGQQGLNTIRLEWQPTQMPTIRAVATDGKRLTQSQVSTGTWLTTAPTAGHALLSHKTAQILHRLFQSTKEAIVQIGLAEAVMTLTLPTLQLSTRLIDSPYPQYENLTPAQLTPCLNLMRKDCIDSLGRLTIIAPHDNPAIDLHLTPTGLVLQADNPQLGFAREEICATIRREGFTVRLNARYLLDALITAPADCITLHMDTPHSPCILTNGDRVRWKAIIMPMRREEPAPTPPT